MTTKPLQKILKAQNVSLTALVADLATGGTGAIMALLSGYSNAQFQSQVDQIEARLQGLEFDLEGNEAAFAAHVNAILQASARTDDELKLRMMRNAVVNLATSGEAGDAIQAILIKKLDDLSPLHLVMIGFLDKPPKGNLSQAFLSSYPAAKNKRRKRQIEQSNGIVLPDFYDEPREDDFVHAIYADLLTQNLASRNDLKFDYTGDGAILSELGQRLAALVFEE